MTEETDRLRGYEITLLRDDMKLSQPDFGKLLGVSPRTVRGWEGGAVIPDSAQFTLRLLRHCLALQGPPSGVWLHTMNRLLGRVE